MSSLDYEPKVIGFAGYSGCGKTTLIEKLTLRFTSAGFDIAVIKHTHHQTIYNKQNSDTERHHLAGARQVILATDKVSNSNMLFKNTFPRHVISLAEHIKSLDVCDLIFVEGFKHATIAKIEVLNKDSLENPLYLKDKNIIAIVADKKMEITKKPFFLRDNVDAIFQFIYLWVIQDKKHANC